MASGHLDPQAPPFLLDPTEDVRARLSKDYANLITGEKSAIQNLVDLNLFILDKYRSLDLAAHDLMADVKTANAKIHDLEREISFMKQENLLLKNQIALTEDATRTLFLRVEGLHEKNGENLLTYVASTLSRTGISCSADDIDYVKRIGKFKPGSARPVLVKFLKESKRNLILYNRANLNWNSNSLIWINDDVSDHTRRQRKTVRDIAAYAKSIGLNDLKVHGDGLIVDGDKFKHQDLDLLPPYISIEIAKQPSNESDLYFQSEHSPLSNFYATPIDDGFGICYTSAEQFFQHKKALFHNYSQTASKILKNRDPYELKRLGNLVQTTQEWRDTEESIMSNIIHSKFTQNPHLADILLNTGTLHLHEASADRKWATGAELASKALQSGSWPGSDRMGYLLENLRAELRGENSANPDNPPPQSPLPPETDDLTPMPEDGEGPESTSQSPHSLNQSSQTTTTHPPSQPTHSEYAPPDLPHSGSPIHSALSSTPAPALPIPPLMQTQTRNHSATPHTPTQYRPPVGRKSLPRTSVATQQVNTTFGARFNSSRRSQPFTSDRAPIRRSARISQSTAFPSSQP